MKTTNKKAREYVQNRIDFRASNTYGETVGEGYIVYSYGRHWPMFIKLGNHWYENKDKYSVTTSKQHGQLHPHALTEKKSLAEMLALRDQIEEKQAEKAVA
jgi:hypothetical protein